MEKHNQEKISEIQKKLSEAKLRVKNLSDRIKKVKSANSKDKIQRLTDSVKSFAQSGFKLCDTDTFNIRMKACKACKHWKASDLSSELGECELSKKSSSRLRLANEKCPNDNW